MFPPGKRIRAASLRQYLTVVLVLSLPAFAGIQRASAGFYAEGELSATDSHQTTVRELLGGRFTPPELKVQAKENASRLTRLEAEKAQRGDDPDFLDEYAVALSKMGRQAEAEKIWKDLLARDPKRFQTQANYATALHQAGRYNDAARHMEEATKLKPGFRSGAEELHLAMIRFQQRQQTEPDYGTRHLFVEELTPVWMNRPMPPKTLEEAQLPTKISSDGVAELLREFPRFGDGWVVLGMLLEQEGRLYQAQLAYEKAIKTGTGQRAKLDAMMEKFKEVAAADQPGRSMGRGLAWSFAAAVAGFLLLKFGPKLVDAVADVRGTRAAARAEARRASGAGQPPPKQPTKAAPGQDDTRRRKGPL